MPRLTGKHRVKRARQESGSSAIGPRAHSHRLIKPMPELPHVEDRSRSEPGPQRLDIAWPRRAHARTPTTSRYSESTTVRSGSLAYLCRCKRISERFRHCLAESPMAYLTRWRLQLGARALTATSRSVAQIASDVGYAGHSRSTQMSWGWLHSLWASTLTLGGLEGANSSISRRGTASR